MTQQLTRAPSGAVRGLIVALASALYACTSSSVEIVEMRSSLMPELTNSAKAPALERAVLDNGVTYLAQPLATSRNEVSLSLVVRAGAWAEDEKESGYAHFVEHLAMRHTQHFTREEQQALSHRADGTWGAATNAHTGAEHTAYHLTVPSSDTVAIRRAIALLKDWATNVVFDERDVEAERLLIASERRHLDSPERTLSQLTRQHLLKGSRFAERTTLGSLQGVAMATPRGLQQFYRRWYHPENLAVVALGAFDPRHMRELVTAAFSPIAKSTGAPTAPGSVLPVRPGPDLKLSVTPGVNLPTAVRLVLKRRLSEAGDVREEVLDDLLSRLVQGRLDERSISSQSAIHQVNGGMDVELPGALRTLGVSVLAQSGEVDKAAEFVLGELRRLELEPLSQLELEQAISTSRKALDAEPDRQPLDSLRLTLSQSFVSGRAVTPWNDRRAQIRKVLSKVSSSEMQRHLKQWLAESERHLMVFEPTASALTSTGRLRELVALAQQAVPSAPEPASDLPSLMDRPPEKGRVDMLERFVSVDVCAWRLHNGATVVFKHRPNDSVLRLRAFSPGGLAQTQHWDSTVARLSSAAMAASGLGTISSASVNQLFRKRNLHIVPWLDSYEEGFTGQTPPEHVELLMQALHLMITDPGTDEEGFRAFVNRQLQGQSHSGHAPQTVLHDELQRAVWQGHPWHTPASPRAIAALDLKSTRNLFRERFGDVGDFTFVFVGNAHPMQFNELVNTYLASLPGTRRQELAREPVARRQRGTTQVRLTQDARNTASVQLEFFGTVPVDSSTHAMLPLLQVVLRERLMEELRERRNGTYDVEVWFEEHVLPDQGQTFGVRIKCDPKRVEELKSAALEVVADLLTTNLTNAEVETLQRLMVNRRRSSRYDPEFWLQELTRAYRRGKDPDAILRESWPVLAPSSMRRATANLLTLDGYADAVLSTPQESGTL